jgi:hypothetical protein
MKAVFTIEQVEDKMVVTVEAAEIVFKQQHKEEIDWTTKSFPDDYVIPDGVEFRISDISGNEVTAFSKMYFFPINPTDHPLHPDFKRI